MTKQLFDGQGKQLPEKIKVEIKYGKNAKGHIIKTLSSVGYNYCFFYDNGLFLRWGKTENDDPEFSPFGPEIIDIEVSSICSKACSFCYKGNTSNGVNMSFETFKTIFDKLPKTVSQIAFGIGDLNANPDLFKIMKYAKENRVVPNITINGKDFSINQAKELAEVCGAVAVSHYNDNDCFNSVQMLTDSGLNQVNIHCLLSEETLDKCKRLIVSASTDKRLSKLNAIVFLWLKPKGPRNTLTQVKSLKQYKELVEFAFQKKTRIGFDSCSASSFMKVINDLNLKELEKYVEPCESTAFSYYINANGIGFPCSFAEGLVEGIDITKIKDSFLNEVWLNKIISNFRKTLISNKDCNGCRVCQLYDLSLK